jgi:hypothetical protein
VPLRGCNKHPNVEAQQHCPQCSKPVCTQCLVDGKFCSAPCRDKYQKFMTNYKKPTDSGRNPILSILLFAAVLAALYFAAKKFGYLPW